MSGGWLLRGIRHTLWARYPLDPEGIAGRGPFPLDWRAHAPRRIPAGQVVTTPGPDGARYANPVAIALHALARHTEHWHSADPTSRAAFLAHAEHLVDSQDDRGGWSYPVAVPRYGVRAGWYSGMAQGLAIAVLDRSHAMTGDERHATAARRAARLLWTPVADGGCATYDGGLPLPEECPSEPASLILNGALFALIGAEQARDLVPEQPLDAAWRRLVGLLPRYDLGYWSRYDLWSATPASYAYHVLHISLLRAAHALTNLGELAVMAERWEGQRRDPRHRARAAIAKAWLAVRSR